MTITQMRKKHSGKGVVIVIPNMRDAKTGFVESWKLLQVVPSLEEVEKVLAYYEGEGFADAVPISMNDDIEIKEKLAAKYFRVLFNQNG